MSIRNISLKIIKFGLLLAFLSLGSKTLAIDIETCSENVPPVGTYLRKQDKNHWKIIITKYRFLEDASNNESLEEYIGVLKIDLVEGFQKFIGTTVSSTPTDYGTKFIENFDNSWNSMKRSIASMKILGTCVKNDRIYISGEWSTKALNRAEKIIEFDQVWDELVNLAVEDSRFDSELKKNPKIFEIKDPKILKEVIDNWRKNGRL